MARANYPMGTATNRTRGSLKMPDQPDPSRLKDPTEKAPEECGQIAVIEDNGNRARATCAERKDHETAREHRAILSAYLPATRTRTPAVLTWGD